MTMSWNRWWLRLGVLAVAAAVAVWAWRLCFPGSETVIRKRLQRLAQLASFGPRDGALAGMADAERLAACFATNVEVQVDLSGYSPTAFEGRERISELAFAARRALSGLSLKFPDVRLTLNPDGRTALVHVTAEFRIAGDRDLEVYPLKLTLGQVAGEWLISKVESEKAL